jgi:hypothetical protein
MSIVGKSNHPVLVKKIPIRVWTLRDEIEAAIDAEIIRAKEAGEDYNLENIKSFYHLKKHPLFDEVADEKEEEQAEGEKSEDEENPEENPEEKNEEEDETPPPEGDEKNEESEDDTEEDSDDGEEGDSDEEDNVVAIKHEDVPEEVKRYVYTPQRVIPPEEKISKGFALLTDINMDEILVFVNKTFTYGQSVVIEFDIPTMFYLSADVKYSNNYAMRSRIISEDKAEHRLQLAFTFLMKGEKTTLRNFLRSIEPDLPKPTKKKVVEEEDDDDFDDLGL